MENLHSSRGVAVGVPYSANNIVSLKAAKAWNYKPQEDITPLEVALLIPLFTFYAPKGDLEAYPDWEKVKRHFEEI